MDEQLLLHGAFGTTAAALVACAAAVILRRAPAAHRNALWRVALVPFWAVPALILVTATEPKPWVVGVPVFPAREAQTPVAPPAVRTGTVPIPSSATIAPANRRPVEAGPGRRPTPVSAVDALLAIWATGSLIAALFLARDVLSMRSLVRQARPGTEVELQARIAGWSARLGLPHPPPVLMASDLSVPMVVGLLRPTLVLPSPRSPDAAAQDPVIVHELAHVWRGDPATRGLACLTLVLWWWHPLAWLVVRALAASAEEACDDWVIWITGDRRGYAHAVVGWAEANHIPGTLPCARAGRGLRRRVERILDPRARPVVALSPRGRTLIVLLAAAAVAAGACLKPVRPAPPARSASKQLADAVARHDPGGIHELLTAGETDPDQSGLTALHRAAREGRADAVQLLLERGADPSALDSKGCTPLHRAAKAGSAEVARVLIAHGADLDRKDIWGFTPVMAAAWQDQLELVDLLLNAGAKSNLGVSAMLGDVETIRHSLDAGTRVNARYACHMTLLHFAAHNGHADLVKLLLERGADVEAKDLSQIAARPLHWAVHTNQVETAKVLIEHGANVNALAADGYALQRAAKRGYTEIARMLLENRADPELKAIWQTALFEAAELGRTEVIDLLLQHGANLMARDPQGRTALHVALERHHIEAARALLYHGADLNARDNQGRTPLTEADVGTARQLRRYAPGSGPRQAAP